MLHSWVKTGVPAENIRSLQEVTSKEKYLSVSEMIFLVITLGLCVLGAAQLSSAANGDDMVVFQEFAAFSFRGGEVQIHQTGRMSMCT